MSKNKKYTPPPNAVFKAGQHKADVTNAITLLSKLVVKAAERAENLTLVDNLRTAVEELTKYRKHLEHL